VGVRDGVTGFHAPDLESFTEGVRQLMSNETLRQDMSAAARAFACNRGWDGVFEQLYRTYEWGLEAAGCKPVRSAFQAEPDDLIRHDAQAPVPSFRQADGYE
jgi:hypothetical protein